MYRIPIQDLHVIEHVPTPQLILIAETLHRSPRLPVDTTLELNFLQLVVRRQGYIHLLHLVALVLHRMQNQSVLRVLFTLLLHRGGLPHVLRHLPNHIFLPQLVHLSRFPHLSLSGYHSLDWWRRDVMNHVPRCVNNLVLDTALDAAQAPVVELLALRLSLLRLVGGVIATPHLSAA